MSGFNYGYSPRTIGLNQLPVYLAETFSNFASVGKIFRGNRSNWGTYEYQNGTQSNYAQMGYNESKVKLEQQRQSLGLDNGSSVGRNSYEDDIYAKGSAQNSFAGGTNVYRGNNKH